MLPRLLLVVVLLLAGWIGSQAVAVRRRGAGATGGAGRVADSIARLAAYEALVRADADRGVVEGEAGTPDWVRRLQARHLVGANPAPLRDPVEDAARVRRHGPNTYLAEVAADNGGRLARWPAREAPLLVWVQGPAGIPGWTPQHRDVVRGALRTWDEAALPVRIAATDDSTAAHVFVLWRRRFPAGSTRIGEADRVTDEHGWVVAASIALAVEEPDGRALDVYTVQNAARHEIGHALGLDHSPVADDIMASHAGRQSRLSTRDLNTARLLYALPPGPLPR